MWQLIPLSIVAIIVGGGLGWLGHFVFSVISERPPRNRWPLSRVTSRTIRSMRRRVEKLKTHGRDDVRQLASQAGWLIGKAAAKLDMDRSEEALIPANAALMTLNWADKVVELNARCTPGMMAALPGRVLRVLMYDKTYSDVSGALITGLEALRSKRLDAARTEFENIWCNRGFGLAPPMEAKIVAVMATIFLVVSTSEEVRQIDPQDYDRLILAALPLLSSRKTWLVADPSA